MTKRESLLMPVLLINQWVNPLWFFFLFSIHFSLNAQQDDIRFNRLGPQEGLSGHFAWDIYQDKHRFIWFITLDGVDRYDGQKFSFYQDKPMYGGIAKIKLGELLAESWGKEVDSLNYFDPFRNAFINNLPKTLKNMEICRDCFLKDPAGNIWLGSNKGIYIYHPATKTFQSLKGRPEVPHSLSSSSITCILKDRQGWIWIGTAEDGLWLKKSDSTFRHFQNETRNLQTLSSNQITRLLESREGFLWVGTNGGLNRLYPITGDINRIELTEASLTNDTQSIGYLFEDSKGKLWIQTNEKGILYFDPLSGQTQHFYQGRGLSISLLWPELIEEDDAGRIWIGSDGDGIDIYHPDNGIFTNYRHDSSNPESLSSNTIREIYKDKTGIIWVSTFGGVNYYDPKAEKFVQFTEDPEGKSHFTSYAIFSGLEDHKGNIWMGLSGGGLLKFNPQTESFNQYINDPNDPNSPFSNVINKIATDKAGNIWITSKGGLDDINDPTMPRHNEAVDVLDPQSGKFTRLLNIPYLHMVGQDLKGRMWVGGVEGLYLFTNINAGPVFFPWHSFRDSSMGHLTTYPNPYFFVEGCKGNFWMISSMGLFKLNPQNQSIQQYLYQPGDSSTLSHNHLWGIHLDENCDIWLASVGGGLNLLSYQQQDSPEPVFQRFTTQNSNIPVDFVYDVTEDDQGRIWLATSTGISRFDSITRQFTNYGPESGMTTQPTTLFPSRDGRLYMGGYNGIAYFYPDSMAENTHFPPIYLSDIQINGESLPIEGSSQSITFTKEILLKHWQNDVTLEFLALNYTEPHKNQFKYRLVGYDPDWRNTDASYPFATYTNLDPTRYTFLVKGSNNDGYWNPEPASLTITILPPWWKTWWAYSLYGLIALSIILGIRRYELNRYRAKAEARRLQELDALKTRLYTNITHEFRTPLALILGMADHVKSQVSEHVKESLQIIKQNGQQLLKLVNQMLDLSKLESGHLKLEMEQGDIINCLQYLMESFHSLAESKKIRLHFLSDVPELFMDYDPERLQHVMSNLLSNAIKFTPDRGDVYISVNSESSQTPSTNLKSRITNHESLHIQVKDSGIGIPAENLPHIFDRFYQVDDSTTRKGEGTGIGLTLTKELVKLMNGEIRVKSPAPGAGGKGSEFTIILPVSREYKIKSKGKETQVDPNIEFPASSTALAPTSNKDKPLMLIVEDNPDLVKYLVTSFNPAYSLEVAYNGQQGIDKAIDLIPDIIITDVMMPEKNGFELCNSLKQHELTSHIPIIMLTAKVDVDSRLTGLRHGADAYLEKPFLQEELKVRIHALLEQRQRLQAYYRSAAGLSEETQPKAPAAQEISLEKAFLAKVNHMIEKHLKNDQFTVEQLCRELFIDPSNLYRKLKALTGINPNQYIRSFRLAKAKKLLVDTDLSIASVADECGFADQNYFSRLFKKETGLTPTNYRSGN